MSTSPASPARETRPSSAGPLVRVENLAVRFLSREGTASAVNGVNFTLDPGEVLCILGESGSGKSVTLRALIRLLPPKRAILSGRITFDGRNVMGLDHDALADIRGSEVAMIFQEPITAFDPVFTVGYQITETVRRHEGVSENDARRRALELLEMVQIPSPERRLNNYPHEMSGGMRQRAMIALALSCRPKLLLADEPTTALDATVQIQILQLLRRLQRDLDMAVLFVTHDVGVAVEISDRIAVMYAGRIVEIGSVHDVIRKPLHPYTQGLLASTVHSGMRGKRLEAIPGTPVNLMNMPPGCAFAPRCKQAEARCQAAVPAEVWLSQTRMASCIKVAATPT